MRYYDQGKNIASEDRSISVQSFGNILSYKISYSPRREFDDLESRQFLSNVRKIFLHSAEEVLLRCGIFHRKLTTFVCWIRYSEDKEKAHFSNAKIKINKFKDTLLIPSGEDNEDSSFYSICYAIVKKNIKVWEMAH